MPAYSDPAADLWLIPVDGGRAVPLGGVGKPYGRVITDRFYGRVSFSPDGRRIVFVADDRRCPVAMGRMFHRALAGRGVATEMVIDPDEGHGIHQLPHREDVLRRTLAWFERHDVARADTPR